jgi:hypothetical protein
MMMKNKKNSCYFIFRKKSFLITYKNLFIKDVVD